MAQIEFVNADLLDTQSIINACEGATYLIHTASPVVFNQPKDASVLVKPAVEGTLAAMRGAHLHKLKRVVLTSSVAAV